MSQYLEFLLCHLFENCAVTVEIISVFTHSCKSYIQLLETYEAEKKYSEVSLKAEVSESNTKIRQA